MKFASLFILSFLICFNHSFGQDQVPIPIHGKAQLSSKAQTSKAQLSTKVQTLKVQLSSTAPGYWQAMDANRINAGDLRLVPSTFEAFTLDLPGLKALLDQCTPKATQRSAQAFQTLLIPAPGKGFQAFAIYEASVMAPELQAKYPEIRTFTGQGIDNPREVIKLDIGPGGFHAMVYGGGGTYAIEPMYAGNSRDYMAFKKADLAGEPFHCQVEGEDVQKLSGGGTNPTGTELRTYRTAVGATGEYTTFHGGTKAQALAAIVTTMNRMNGIYERDFTVTMVLVANNDTLIYTDGNTDPYTNNNLGTILGENQDLCDSLIGSANYDVGHVFGTAGGGLAGVGVVCGGSKAIGATGLSSPVGDFFSVDYVSHEFGHQFSGGHTFNDCGGQANDSYEPGSGVTIMAYAGLCGTSNIQSNSVDQFHVNTYDEVIFFTQTGNANSCPVITPTGNTPPSVTVPASGFYIPFQTPFELVASATDIEGDSLTYCWEQFDLGPQTHPDSAAGTAPLFRTFHAGNDPVRICPQISDLVNNVQTIGELLPQFGREMNFRVLVRDNVAGGGGADYGHLTFQVADSAGPFAVVTPNGGQFWTVGDIETITWDVANSDQAPVSCQEVDIWLSEDGGFTYPHLLASNRPNNGSAAITVPNIVSNAVRIKVKASDNIFFDVSNNNSIIYPAQSPDYTLTVNNPLQVICGSDTALYTVDLDTLFNFADPVTLTLIGNPTGTDFAFTSNPVTPPGTVILSVYDTAAVVPGDYTMTLQANASSGIRNMPLTLRVRSGSPSAVSLVSPFNGAANVPGNSVFTWNSLPFVSSYAIEISESPTFVPLAQGATGVTSTNYTPLPDLNPNSVYFWRVKADQSDCGPGDWSPTFSFQTELLQCATYMSIDTPVSISGSGTPTIYSQLDITQNILLSDVNVIDLIGEHTWMSDLNFRLIGPNGDTIPLFGNICGNNDDFDIAFDDASVAGQIPCPPVSGLAYQPQSPLSVLNGSNAFGTWYMEVFDDTNQDGGELQSWGLELCGPPLNNAVPTVTVTALTVTQGDTGQISNAFLSGNCNPTQNVLEYTLTALPASGILLLNGVPLAVGDTFTQDDIDNNLLTYAHNGQNTVPDQFEYIVYCPAGGYTGGLVFPINVSPFVGIYDADLVDFTVYPNPASSAFRIRFEGNPTEFYQVQLVDIMGRIVVSGQLGEGETLVDVSHLAAGVYSCQILSSDQKIGEKKVVVLGE